MCRRVSGCRSSTRRSQRCDAGERRTRRLGRASGRGWAVDELAPAGRRRVPVQAHGGAQGAVARIAKSRASERENKDRSTDAAATRNERVDRAMLQSEGADSDGKQGETDPDTPVDDPTIRCGITCGNECRRGSRHGRIDGRGRRLRSLPHIWQVRHRRRGVLGEDRPEFCVLPAHVNRYSRPGRTG